MMSMSLTTATISQKKDPNNISEGCVIAALTLLSQTHF
jgi:hypothetical protein